MDAFLSLQGFEDHQRWKGHLTFAHKVKAECLGINGHTVSVDHIQVTVCLAENSGIVRVELVDGEKEQEKSGISRPAMIGKGNRVISVRYDGLKKILCSVSNLKKQILGPQLACQPPISINTKKKTNDDANNSWQLRFRSTSISRSAFQRFNSASEESEETLLSVAKGTLFNGGMTMKTEKLLRVCSLLGKNFIKTIQLDSNEAAHLPAESGYSPT